MESLFHVHEMVEMCCLFILGLGSRTMNHSTKLQLTAPLQRHSYKVDQMAEWICANETSEPRDVLFIYPWVGGCECESYDHCKFEMEPLIRSTSGWKSVKPSNADLEVSLLVFQLVQSLIATHL